MLEAYAVTIDLVYRACALIEAAAGRDIRKAQSRKFDHAGVEGKLETIEKEFEILSHTRPTWLHFINLETVYRSGWNMSDLRIATKSEGSF